MPTSYRFLAPGAGTNYDWSADHTFVKVSAEDTGGEYTLMEDNLKAGFKLGLHLHRKHAETFYILEGEIDFYVDGDWMTATPGSSLHIPPGVPHACELRGAPPARMLMIYQPSGFDGYLAELAKMTDKALSSLETMKALEERYDIVQLGDVPER